MLRPGLKRNVKSTKARRRPQRVAARVRQLLWELLRREAHLGESLTIAHVDISPDLRRVVAFVLPLGAVWRQGAAAAEAVLAQRRPHLQALLGRALGLKYTPQLDLRVIPDVEADDHRD